MNTEQDNSIMTSDSSLGNDCACPGNAVTETHTTTEATAVRQEFHVEMNTDEGIDANEPGKSTADGRKLDDEILNCLQILGERLEQFQTLHDGEHETNAKIVHALETLPSLFQNVGTLLEIGHNGLERLEKMNELFSLMTDYKNKCTLQLTKFAEVFERINSLQEFSEKLLAEDEQDENLLSLKRRVRNLHRTTQKLLLTFGVVPIYPARNADLNPAEHQIMAETEAVLPEDKPGCIAECLKIGFLRNGVIDHPAQVIVFKTPVETVAQESNLPPTTANTME